MTALVGAASLLGIWCAASLLSVPVLVLCLRSQSRVNARITRQFRRDAWLEATRR